MKALLLGVLAVQGLVMFFDEFYFHRRRGLPLWERIGHPVDTLSVIACYGIALLLPPSMSSLGVYAATALFSCLLVTKDEFVHARVCEPAEHWVHAVLFVLHPVVLGAAALLWFRGERGALYLQAGITTLFMFYQIGYWNLVRTTQ